jgi:hypothetical protein
MFGPMIAGAACAGVAGVLSLRNHYRAQLGAMTALEARRLASMPVTPIRQAGDGYVKIAGVIVGDAVTYSYYHRVPCVALKLDHYEVHDAIDGPRRLLVRSEHSLHPFFIEDETGRLAIDPVVARIDYEVEGLGSESTVEERRLRVGDSVLVLAHVRRSGPRIVHPMRHPQSITESSLEIVGSPLVTWRSEPEVFPRLTPPTGGVLLSAMSAACGALGALLDL